MGYKEEFIALFNEHVHREGAAELLAWLESTDFFEAPASTRFHGACAQGLVLHSLNVYKVLRSKFCRDEENMESVVIAALLHDVCKANYYTMSTRNVKNKDTGRWEEVPFYSIVDELPYGHGEKSVWMIERHMRLTVEEAIAIRWHMGGFDDAARGGCKAISEAYDAYPLAVKLHMADLAATYLLEKGTSSVNKAK